MSSVTITKSIMNCPYEAFSGLPMERVFICTECHRVIASPVTNLRWSPFSPYSCLSEHGGCGHTNTMIPVDQFKKQVIPEATISELSRGKFICHSSFFAVDNDGLVYLRKDLTDERDLVLGKFINNRVEKIDYKKVVEELKKNPEAMKNFLSDLFH